MDRDDCAYVINSCPKYYDLLVPHLILLKRYCPDMKWPIYIGSEEPEHKTIKICESLGANIIPLSVDEESFWESRVATVSKLPSKIQYVFPMQEDFLLERHSAYYDEFKKVMDAMDSNLTLLSARVMPCPGPKGSQTYMKGWAVLSDADDYLFTFQATLWRREVYCQYLEKIIETSIKNNPYLLVGSAEWNRHAINVNLAENSGGCKIFRNMFQNCIHLAWKRVGSYPNGVYNCPFPYRPTAVVKGVLQEWAKEFLDREGLSYSA